MPLLFLILLLTSVGFPTTSLETRSAAPIRFIAAHGRRAWAGGYSNGGLEIWTGALQIASNVRPEFQRSGDVTAIPGVQILSETTVAPAFVARTYTGPDFSVEERVWVTPDQPAVLIEYDVRSANPVRVVVRFRPSLNLMWPAAVGGQAIRWDVSQSAYLLTDGAQQFAAEIAAPGASLHDAPLNSPHPLPQMDELAVALDPQSPKILFAQVRAEHANANAGGLDYESMKAVLRSSQWKQEAIDHYERVLGSQVKIETPDTDLNSALAWSEIALDQDWVCNDPLGCGYVGGFGPSRRNRRPQYAWFFAGDGMVAARGAMAAGDLERARDELRFIAKYQNAETGMIWHELTQSAPYIDWRTKYPYMFVHADLTYPYISTVAAYVRTSGDLAFLQEIWPSVQKAFSYGRSLVASDGLPQVPQGKEGANEQNPMREELGMSADWVTACGDYSYLAGLMHQPQLSQEAHSLAEKARASFVQRYWDRQRNFPIQGYGQNGEATIDRGLGAVAAIGNGLFSEEQSAQLLEEIASWRFQTDWGTRSVAIGEPGFDPTEYAHGSVWALGTAGVAEAYWYAHRPEIAWEVWRTLIPWSSLDSIGHMDEVLAGDTYHPQMESVPEQTWSSAGFLSTAVHGLFGVDVDAEKGVVTLAPHLPAEWERAAISDVKVRNAKLSFSFEQEIDSLTLHVKNDGETVQLHYSPAVPLGASHVTAATAGGQLPVKVEAHSQDEHASIEISVPRGESDIVVRYHDAIGIVMGAPHPALGAPSTGMKLAGVTFAGNELHLELDVVPGRENKLQLWTYRVVASAPQAKVQRLKDGLYELTVLSPTNAEDGYQRRQVTVKFAKKK